MQTFLYLGQIILNASQIANDIAMLHRVVRSYANLAGSRIVGPDGGDVYTKVGFELVENVANVTGSFLTAITFHHYYFNGKIATYEKYLDPSLFKMLRQYIGERMYHEVYEYIIRYRIYQEMDI